MDDYEWDVFISYRRFPKWEIWLDKHFVPFLRRNLTPEIGKKDLKIFVDRKDIVEGVRWHDDLRHALAKSRILVPVFCAHYWRSLPCKQELAVILEREEKLGYRQPDNLRSLVVPVLLHDGEQIPDLVSPISRFDAREFAYTYLSSKTKFDKFTVKIAERIASHYMTCPPYDPTWVDLTGESYIAQLNPKVTNGEPRLA